MYELEYLYEDLKTRMIEESYILTLNSVSEACYDVIEARRNVEEAVDAITEASSKNKFTYLDKLKANFMKTEKIIEKHKDAALKAKPIGLQYKGFKTFVSDSEIAKRRKAALDYLNKFNVKTASEDELRKYIKDSQNNVQYNKVNDLYKLDGKLFTGVISEKDKEITKSDIAEAVKFIENYEKTITSLRTEAQKIDKEFTDYVRGNNDFKDVISMNKTDGDINKLRKNALNHQKSLISIADSTYYQLLLQKYNVQIMQCKQIVVKAANYNPRNLKESYKIQDYIDSLFDCIED